MPIFADNMSLPWYTDADAIIVGRSNVVLYFADESAFKNYLSGAISSPAKIIHTLSFTGSERDAILKSFGSFWLGEVWYDMTCFIDVVTPQGAPLIVNRQLHELPANVNITFVIPYSSMPFGYLSPDAPYTIRLHSAHRMSTDNNLISPSYRGCQQY